MKLWPAKEDMLYSPDGATVPSVQGEARTYRRGPTRQVDLVRVRVRASQLEREFERVGEGNVHEARRHLEERGWRVGEARARATRLAALGLLQVTVGVGVALDRRVSLACLSGGGGVRAHLDVRGPRLVGLGDGGVRLEVHEHLPARVGLAVVRDRRALRLRRAAPPPLVERHVTGGDVVLGARDEAGLHVVPSLLLGPIVARHLDRRQRRQQREPPTEQRHRCKLLEAGVIRVESR
eukprot:scaffold30752_cov41-Phaeocystis_antarctica.AAC.3